MDTHSETIAAIATPPGNGGVGIIRISGTKALAIARYFLNKTPIPRYVHYTDFTDQNGTVIDSGLLLYFKAPHSFTGEDILELQGHGGSVVMDILLRRILAFDVRLARPGEFSERAFLNNKLDLAQAEAIADLINSSTEQSARCAGRSMQGVFSKKINALLEELIELRTYVEAAIDFVDEEIDFLSDGIVEKKIIALAGRIRNINRTAQQGQLLRDGMNIVLAGKPNAGKSSLLNALAGFDVAIVTDIAGTTRDILRQSIQIDGMPLHIIDTAGLRDSENVIEKEGIRRAHQEIQQADRVLLLVDSREQFVDPALLQTLPGKIPITVLYNKIDLTGQPPGQQDNGFYISVKTGAGMDLLKQHLKTCMGYQEDADNVFIARRRHIEALNQAHAALENGLQHLRQRQAGELVAEELRLAQNSLGEITGKFTSDDLLGRIFSSFCIGK